MRLQQNLPPSENIQKPCGYHLKFGVARAHSLRKGTSNAICKLWPPLTTCRPGLAWKPPASTLAHRLAVIHPDIRTRWPERLRTQPVPSTADVRTAPQHAPHTRPMVREKISNRDNRHQRGHALDQLWVGQGCWPQPAQDVAEHNETGSRSLPS